VPQILKIVIKTFLILIFSLLVNISFSQEVESVYRFKKVKKQTYKNSKTSYFEKELDSLVLYKNGEFYRQTNYSQFDNFGFEVQKGQWRIENGILYLNIIAKNENFENEKWFKYSGEFKYSIKRKKLIPINDSFEIYAKRNLKLIN
jgi:hypothetical protein